MWKSVVAALLLEDVYDALDLAYLVSSDEISQGKDRPLL